MKSKIIPFGIYLYIALPFIIFAGGFLNLYFALPMALAVIISVFLAAKSSEGIDIVPGDKFTPFKIVFVLLFITAIVFLSGIGNVLWQDNDHATRNTLFDILTSYSWPPTETVNGEKVGLVYYIGFWLPAALAGKLLSLEAGYVFQIIWAVLGLFILWYLLCIIHKKIVIYPLVLFMFFSGLDLFGHSIISAFFTNLSKLQIGVWAFPQGSAFTSHIEWWAKYFQYSSHTTQLFWVFNQCIPVWLATVLILLEKNNKNLVFIMGLTLLSSTLPFVGLIPIFIWCAVCDHEGNFLDRPFTKDFKKSFLSLFTYQNVVGGGISGIVSFLYLKGNIASSSTSSQTATPSGEGSFSIIVFICVILVWSLGFILLNKREFSPAKLLYLVPMVPLAFLLARLPVYKIEYYLLFIIFEFLILALFIMPAHGRSSLFFITISCLLIIPFFVVGKSIDFCMRASIPLLALLCLFAISALDKYFKEDRQILATLLCTVLMLGAITPCMEIARTVEATAYEIRTKGKVENDSKTIEQVFKGKNFTGKTEGNIFFDFFAK